MEQESSVSESELLPNCWSLQKYSEFKQKHDGLMAKNKGLGCVHCAKIKSLNIKRVHIAKQWVEFTIFPFGKDKKKSTIFLKKTYLETF